ncbi:MAG: bifunctional diaminohydroxyphosphoribosylaminopyrimidine deaminase/5-amino-6-(5-phosphoribosylamino)uracil reductase RibD [Phycisphaerales bacterium]|nr:MAG: bifunctional diaminohydroxyphosphoribosylaminopyrimidine deaminase/5-amino-6-(5-phosphoribosylamino)uracil reductase RibD [Phycisphaerales bacterium]
MSAPAAPASSRLDRRMLDTAARAALRAWGDVEPNPMVGCVIGTPAGEIIGVGHHRRYGEAHAEVEALRACAAAGRNARGATAWVTLEPCNHTGKTPPCAHALIEAGVREVVYARPDPNPVSTGGDAALRAAGVLVRRSDASVLASRLAEPFAHAIETGRPWVVAKWAQTIDGRIATRTGESQWISCERSRAQVHRLRARVDAILTGIGTVIADDPRLTPRGVRRIRRTALRIVVDPHLRTPLESALVGTITQAPLLLFARDGVLAAQPAKADRLRAAGAEVIGLPDEDRGLDLARALADLRRDRGVSTVLVEAGPTLLGRLVAADLIDEAWVYVAPMLLGDDEAMPSVHGRTAPRLADARVFDLCLQRRIDRDALLVYRRAKPAAPLSGS